MARGDLRCLRLSRQLLLDHLLDFPEVAIHLAEACARALIER